MEPLCGGFFDGLWNLKITTLDDLAELYNGQSNHLVCLLSSYRSTDADNPLSFGYRCIKWNDGQTPLNARINATLEAW